MSHVIRLIQGFDLRNPTRTLDLLSPDLTASATIFPAEEGFAPGPGTIKVQWSGRSGRYDGERRASSSRDNMELSYKYILSGGSAAAVDELNRQILGFFRDTQLFEEHRIGEPVWAQMCWDQGLMDIDTLPAPAIGQLFRYVRVLHGEVKSWPANVSKSGHLQAGKIIDVVMDLVCEPFYYGLEEAAFAAVGQISLADGGVTVGEFLAATQDQAATGATSAQQINGVGTVVQTFTAGASGYLTYVRLWRNDTGAAASGTVSIYLVSPLTLLCTQSVIFSSGYGIKSFYLSPAPAITSGTQYRIQITVASNVELRTTPNTYAGGQAVLAGTPQAFDFYFSTHVSTTQSVGYLQKQLSDEVTYPYTLMFWASPATASPEHSSRRTLCEYYLDSNSYYEVYRNSDGTLGLYYNEAGVFELSASDPGTVFHVAVVFSAGPNVAFYVNGALAASRNGGFTALATGGLLTLGAQNDGEQLAYAALDGFRLWPGLALTAARINAIYSAELTIKTAGRRVGGPLFWRTGAGSYAVDNPGYGLLGGVSGDVDALVEWRMAPVGEDEVIEQVYMGRRASASAFDPADNLISFLDDTDAGQTGVVSTGVFTVDDAATIRGRVHLLLSLSCNGADAILTPQWRSAATFLVQGDPVTIGDSATEGLRDLGDMMIDWPGQDTPAISLEHVLDIDGTATTYKGYSIVLPAPNCLIITGNVTFETNYQLVIGQRTAYIIDTSTNTIIAGGIMVGDEVTVEPGKYNYVVLAVGTAAGFDDGVEYVVVPWVKPRWLLPGGIIG